jgi:ankyrin repeat protein
MWGADVNAVDNQGKTALTYAVEQGHKSLATALMMSGK